MAEFGYRVDESVFARFPDYVRGVVVARDVKNGETPADLVARLREAEASLRSRLSLDTVADLPAISSWREAFRSFGASPSKFRPSIEALVRRALRGEDLPSISKLVDIGTIVSLRFLAPVGGHALDDVRADLELRTATGNESFIAFGSDELEQPSPGEIIFAEGDVVLTRRWTWRQAKHTIVADTTRFIEFNVDGLPPTSREEVEKACQETAGLVQELCGGSTSFSILSRDNPSMIIAHQ